MRKVLSVAALAALTLTACSTQKEAKSTQPAGEKPPIEMKETVGKKQPTPAPVAMPPYVTAAAWGSKPDDMSKLAHNDVKFLTIHHEGEIWYPGMDPMKKLPNLQAWGKTEKHWPDVPYHWLIGPDGKIYEGRSMEYPPDTNTTYKVDGHIGVMLYGNFMEQRVNVAMLQSAVELSAFICQKYRINPDEIAGHKDRAPTDCPGLDFYRYRVFLTDDERWSAVLTKKPDAENAFIYAVETTGVFCRPTCASRTPLRKNVRFFDDVDAAERAGFRACLRCCPKEDSADAKAVRIVVRCCRALEEDDEDFSLAEFAAGEGLSESRLTKIFRELVGVTPNGFAKALRRDRLQTALQSGASVSDAVYQSGFNSSSRYYEKSNELLGMTGGKYRKGGADETINFATAPSSIGKILVAMTARGVCAIKIGDDVRELAEDLRIRFPQAREIKPDAAFSAVFKQVVALADGPATANAAIPLDIRGTAFQQQVWKALQDIPLGETITYSELAARVSRPKAVRAVGSACGANPAALAIPCHRVVRGTGEMGGYRWGIERKERLIASEASARNRKRR
ncbi:hypothetical protein BH09SUM1_BH09SUM1_24650 [soil metagenome]